MKAVAVTVTTSATLVIAADNINRTCYIHTTSGSAFLGDSAVTDLVGLHVPNNATMTILVPANETVYAIASSGTTNMRVLTPNVD